MRITLKLILKKWCNNVDWVQLVQDVIGRRPFVDTVMNLGVRLLVSE